MGETIKPPLVPPLEALKSLLVYHPITDELILQFGCRIPFNETLAMSYSLVHQAATVITQRNGYLSLSQDRGRQPTETDEDLIVAGNYYFHASDPALADYEILGDIDSWEPPASVDDLPEPWRTLAIRFNELEIEVPIECDAMKWVRRTDPVCMLTGSRDVTECQRLVPLAHEAWASHYHILRRASPAPHGHGNTIPITATRLLDDVRSLVTLSPSAHRLMADAFFCPYPLTGTDGVYVAYFVILHRTDSGGEHHLRTLHVPERVSPYFLYLRFVWTMFKCVPPHNEAVRRKVRPAWDLRESELGDIESHSSIGGASGDEDMPSDASSHPSITSERDDAEAKERLIPPQLLQLFADVEAGKRNPPAVLYEYEQVYPGMARIAHVKNQYIKEHPQAVATTGSSTARHDGELEA